MNVSIIPKKEVYSNPSNQYRVLACDVTSSNPDDNIRYNKYGNINLVGNNLNVIKIGTEINVSIVPDTESKYTGSYLLTGFTGLASKGGRIKVEPPQDYQLLTQIMERGQADNVYEAYPNFVELVMNNETDQIDVKKIYNVGDYRLKTYIDKIHQHFSSIVFAGVAEKYGITNSQCADILSKVYTAPEYFDEAMQQTPYQVLIDTLDYKFEKADRLTKKFNAKSIHNEERALYYTLGILDEVKREMGDTRVLTKDLREETHDNHPSLLPYLKNIVMNSDRLHYDAETMSVGLKALYTAETTIRDNIMRRVKYPISFDMDWKKYKNIDGLNCTDEQIKILEIAAHKSIGLLMGSAGTGKTTSTKALIKMLDDNNKDYLLLAPTGIASKRLAEATGRQAQTIAKFLVTSMLMRKDAMVDEMVGYGESDGTFYTTDCDYLIIDEFSMVGVSNFALLLSFIPPETKIILVCDNAQLASIDCGNILQDLIESEKIPTAMLSKVFRYGIGGIATVATDTRNGEFGTRATTKYPDYHYLDLDESDPLGQVMSVYKEVMESGIYGVNDVLVLTPFNVKAYGTYAINTAIQKLYKAPKGAKEYINHIDKNTDMVFHVGDKVVNTKNDYHVTKMVLGEDGKYEPSLEETAIFNGDIGYIRDIKIEDNAPSLMIQFDEQMVLFNASEASNLLLGYAMTIHRVQGSQAKVVIMLTPPEYHRMMTRNLLYVGESRAQELLYEIGKEEIITDALTVEENKERNTWLGGLLNEG